MHRIVRVFASLSLAALPLGLAAMQEPTVNVISAKKSVGEVVTVCGHATQYRCANPYTTLTLAPAQDPMPFEVALVDPDGSQFGRRPEERFLNRVICARGRVEQQGRRYRVRVTDRSHVALARDQPTPGLTPFAPDAHSACEPGVTLPVVVQRTDPRYTADALRARIQGTVLLRAVVMPDGRVGQMQVLRTVEPGLDLEALRAFGQWVFEPGRYMDQVAPIVITAEMTFIVKK